MARFNFDWKSAKAAYEAGESITTIARRTGCSRTAVTKRATAEDWQRPEPGPVGAMVPAFGNIADRPLTPPQFVSEVLLLHRDDWGRLRPLHKRAMRSARTAKTERALLVARITKLLIDGMRSIQSGERAAWGIGVDDSPFDGVADDELQREIDKAAERIAHDSATVH